MNDGGDLGTLLNQSPNDASCGGIHLLDVEVRKQVGVEIAI